MGEKIKFVIPSHKRHDRVIARELVDDMIICVSKSQAPLYRQHNPDNEIVIHPDTLIGLSAKRQWIYEKFKQVWMIDDDVTAIKRVYTEDNYIVDKPTATRILTQIYELAEDLNIYLFGIAKNPHPLNYNPQKPIFLSGFISGGVHGVRGFGESKIKWAPGFVNEDVYISLLNAFHHRKCLIDTRFVFHQKDTFAATGGLSEFRTPEVFKKEYYELRRLFGDAVRRKRSGRLAKAKVEYAITGHINI